MEAEEDSIYIMNALGFVLYVESSKIFTGFWPLNIKPTFDI